MYVRLGDLTGVMTAIFTASGAKCLGVHSGRWRLAPLHFSAVAHSFSNGVYERLKGVRSGKILELERPQI